MTDLAIVLASGLVIAFIGAVYAYGRLTKTVDHLSIETKRLGNLFENHLKHSVAATTIELSAIKTEIALIKERIERFYSE